MISAPLRKVAIIWVYCQCNEGRQWLLRLKVAVVTAKNIAL